MTKEEKIKDLIIKSWADKWEKLPTAIKNYALENNGFIHKRNVIDFLGYSVWSSPELESSNMHFRPKSISGIEENYGWQNVKDRLPDEGVEVLCFNENWINEDFNPKGIRIGFLNGTGCWLTSHWWDSQDCYVTISEIDCNEEEFCSELRENINPTHYKEIISSPIY